MSVPERIIDVHAHIIPGVDDGSRTMEESLQLLRMAAEQGVIGVIATPHYSRRDVLTGVREQAAELQEEMRKIYPDFQVYPGQETFYHEGLTERLKAGEAYTMAESRYVLVEFDPSVSYSTLFQGIRKLSGSGYHPVLAHMERYGCLREKGTQELRSCGCILQMNYESLEGRFYQPEVRWCRKQVEAGVIHLLGTDMHRIDYRPPRIRKALQWLEDHVSPEAVSRMVCDNPLHIIKKERMS